MIYRLLAELTMSVHFAFLLFVVAGGILVRWRRWIAWLHVPSVLWGGLMLILGWACPLTPLENHFLRLAGEAGYEGGFIDHYLAPLLYPEGLERGDQILWGAGALVLNGAIYAWVFKAWVFTARARPPGREGRAEPEEGTRERPRREV